MISQPFVPLALQILLIFLIHPVLLSIMGCFFDRRLSRSSNPILIIPRSLFLAAQHSICLVEQLHSTSRLRMFGSIRMIQKSQTLVGCSNLFLSSIGIDLKDGIIIVLIHKKPLKISSVPQKTPAKMEPNLQEWQYPAKNIVISRSFYQEKFKNRMYVLVNAQLPVSYVRFSLKKRMERCTIYHC